ncbi:hypothetical protein NDU88_003539 [Pleurodeles waltl]|uniref:Uncharacterized protein n=1 Tax=Pleurodeles waltl TaxID=8319 RepID=A0AAV7PA68_PLEWA|nr:hypothetical protein NDU88_003539 [Pleurodeles waltl]
MWMWPFRRVMGRRRASRKVLWARLMKLQVSRGYISGRDFRGLAPGADVQKTEDVAPGSAIHSSVHSEELYAGLVGLFKVVLGVLMEAVSFGLLGTPLFGGRKNKQHTGILGSNWV